MIKFTQWPHDSYMTGRVGVWEADDIVKFYIALLDFFSSYFINEVHFWHCKKYGSVGRFTVFGTYVFKSKLYHFLQMLAYIYLYCMHIWLNGQRWMKDYLSRPKTACCYMLMCPQLLGYMIARPHSPPPFQNYRHGMCFRASSVFVVSILLQHLI
jgi:hypothetical protein